MINSSSFEPFFIGFFYLVLILILILVCLYWFSGGTLNVLQTKKQRKQARRALESIKEKKKELPVNNKDEEG